MSIIITKAGICDTIQDAGRNGFANYGINPSGVMDVLAMKTANALAGNPLDCPVLEIHFPACVMECTIPILIGLAGADFDAGIYTTDGVYIKVPVNKTALLPAGSRLVFHGKKWGERCYLAVHGGFNLPVWFGSYSTNIKIKQGGYKGRKLLKGDQLEIVKPVKEASAAKLVFAWVANIQSWYGEPHTFSILQGPEWDWLEPAAKNHFLKNDFTIAPHSDRMGISLQGLPLQPLQQEQLLSGGVTFGTIQLLPNGQMIILAADHPTTGGYPRIATIISADLPKLVQAATGSKINFIKTGIEQAEALLMAQHKDLIQLKQAVLFNLNGII